MLPTSVNLTAFEIKFESTCVTRFGSVSIRGREKVRGSGLRSLTTDSFLRFS